MKDKIEAETKEIEEVDEEENYCADYYPENYDAGGYFPSYEEDRRGMDYEYEEESRYYINMAFRHIRQKQRSDENILPAREFQIEVQKSAKWSGIKGFTQDAYYCLLDATENYLTKWLKSANLIAIARNSRIVTVVDMSHAHSIIHNIL